METITNILKNFIRAIELGIKERNAYRSLSALSDRELKDIGICRNDIPRVIMEMREKETL